MFVCSNEVHIVLCLFDLTNIVWSNIKKIKKSYDDGFLAWFGGGGGVVRRLARRHSHQTTDLPKFTRLPKNSWLQAPIQSSPAHPVLRIQSYAFSPVHPTVLQSSPVLRIMCILCVQSCTFASSPANIPCILFWLPRYILASDIPTISTKWQK